MTSSGDRRRPRVAGERRRHGRAPGAAPSGPAASDVPEEPGVEEAPRGAAALAAEEGDDTTPGTPRTAAPAVEDAEAPRRRTVALRDLRAPVLALVVALVAFALVAVVGLRDHGARERDARAATAAATSALEQLLSYDYRTIGEQAQRNSDLLTGSFKAEYGTTMSKTIAPVAEKEKAVVQARASEAGVMGQTPDTVTVEVFVNQAKTAQGEDQPSVDQNRVIATMSRVGDRWLISGLSAF